MEENVKKKRLRKVSSWMSDATYSISHEEEILATKKIVLKVIKYMEANHMSQKGLADKLGVSPQYINKFLHGQDCDIKVSTAYRYGKALGIRLIEIPDDIDKTSDSIIWTTMRTSYYNQFPVSADLFYDMTINDRPRKINKFN